MFGSSKFQGRYVLVWSKPPVQGGLLVDAQLKSVGGSTFVVGRMAKDGSDDPRLGLTYWFPLRDVLRLTEFPTIKEANAYMAEWKKSQPDVFS